MKFIIAFAAFLAVAAAVPTHMAPAMHMMAPAMHMMAPAAVTYQSTHRSKIKPDFYLRICPN